MRSEYTTLPAVFIKNVVGDQALRGNQLLSILHARVGHQFNHAQAKLVREAMMVHVIIIDSSQSPLH